MSGCRPPKGIGVRVVHSRLMGFLPSPYYISFPPLRLCLTWRASYLFRFLLSGRVTLRVYTLGGPFLAHLLYIFRPGPLRSIPSFL